MYCSKLELCVLVQDPRVFPIHPVKYYNLCTGPLSMQAFAGTSLLQAIYGYMLIPWDLEGGSYR